MHFELDFPIDVDCSDTFMVSNACAALSKSTVTVEASYSGSAFGSVRKKSTIAQEKGM